MGDNGSGASDKKEPSRKNVRQDMIKILKKWDPPAIGHGNAIFANQVLDKVYDKDYEEEDRAIVAFHVLHILFAAGHGADPEIGAEQMLIYLLDED